MYELSAFDDLELRPEDFEGSGPGISLNGAAIPKAVPERWETACRSNVKVREAWNWQAPGRYPTASEAANAVAWYAGKYGLTKEEAAAVLVAFYAVPGRKPLHRAKLEKTLRAWAKGREWAKQREKSRSNGRGVEQQEVSAKAEAEHLTDLGNARRLVALHGADVQYSYPRNSWLVWDGRRWKADDTGEAVRRAKATVAAMYAEAAEAPDKDRRATLAAHAVKCESDSRIRAMLSLAQSEPRVAAEPNAFDGDPWLLNVMNGTLDLRTGDLRPHRREDLLTKLTPIEYDPHAKAPIWRAFLDRITAGNPYLIGFLQKAVGYALTGDVSEQALFFLHGAGANGKTTFLNAILETVGDYGRQAAPDLLAAKYGIEHPTALADLRGCRFVASVEVEEGKRLAEVLVKQLTGGDRLKARHMREDFFEFSPTHKIFLAANHKPVIRGTDLAIWRRIRLVPFTVTIPEDEQDKALAAKLRAELPGILTWAVLGCLAWQEEGLKAPEAVRLATQQYREESDQVGLFLEECCVLDACAIVVARDLYAAYVKWSEENGERPRSQTNFGSRLRERGLSSGRQGGGGKASWHGVALNA